MWSIFATTDAFCITTNAILNSAGALVMGRGIARQASDRIPGLAATAGRKIAEKALINACYGLLDITPAGAPERPRIVAFQTKIHWRWPSDLEVIAEAAQQLGRAARRRPKWRFDLNYPGIGAGRLDPGAVLEILRPLPRNVFIWRR